MTSTTVAAVNSTAAVNPIAAVNPTAAVDGAAEVVEEVKPINPKVKEILKMYKNPNFSFSHSCLVERVSKHPVLENWIKQKIARDPRIINLATHDWLSVLENNLTFQEYFNEKKKFFEYKSKTQENTIIYRLRSHTNNLNVIAVGIFKVTKDKNKDSLRLKLVECIPVQCIAEIMCLQTGKEVFSNAKFFIKTCKGFCIKCRKNKVTSDNVWCLQRTMVYENEKIQYAERKYCTSMYPDEFKALVHLELNSAYSFTSGSKIGGNAESIVFIENIFDFNDNNDVQRILKTDENFVPHEEYINNGIEGQVKTDENFVPQETGIKRTIENENENSNKKCFKNENFIPDQECGTKRKNEDGIENDKKKVLKSTEDDTETDVLAIPQGTNYTNPQGKSFEVTSTIENMPNI